MLLWLTACGWPVQAPSHDAAFPHPEGYEQEGHGPDAVAPEASCGRCHGAGEAGASCASCHPHYPHPDSFAAGAEHGETTPECDACHGADGQRVPAGVEGGACVHCHSTWPHPEGWAEATAHGVAQLARGTPAACESCHPPGAPGDCAECHAWPHPPGMLESHGPAWVDGDQACGSCHETGGAGGSCAGCHLDVPHPDGWATGGHLAAVQARGAATCTGCHPDGSLVGPTLPQSCAAACHGEGP